MENEYEFEIGDLVYLQTEITQIEFMTQVPEANLFKLLPGALIIQERHLQQCHGGEQKFYTCKTFGRDGEPRFSKFIALELVKKVDAHARLLPGLKILAANMVAERLKTAKA